MAVQSERIPNRLSFFRKRRHPHARESHFQPSPASADKKSASSLREALGALLGKLSIIPLGILLVYLCLALSGYVLGKLSPEYMVTVQPFEIFPEVGNRSSLSGKGASDIVVDILNDAASHAAQFHGTDYYKYVDAGAQPVSLHQVIKVPIQTSYGIELKGISVDSVLHLYEQARYDQWIIGGDVVSSREGLVGKIRLNNGHTAKSWETPPSAHATPSELVREATYLMLAKEAPELLGRSYLQQAKYDVAEKVFRQWAIDDPQNWKPSYYLSLLYSYQDKTQEASTLAKWSNNLIKGEETNRISKKRLDSTGSEKEIASRLAQTTKIALQTKGTSDPQKLHTLQQTLGTLGQGQSRLSRLLKRSPANVDYQIQQARVLDKEALLELDRNPPKAYALSRQAADILDDAIQSVPENGGLHEQRAIVLLHLVSIMKKQAKGSQDIKDAEIDEAKEYTRALELRPTEDSALWGAVYVQMALGNHEDAVDLARTITLLRPDSNAASTAYIVAQERAIKTLGKDPEGEKEVKDRLKRLLESNPDESQLIAIWDALVTNNDREGLDLVATGAKRLFPESSAFEERKLQSYLVGLPHYDGQTGSCPENFDDLKDAILESSKKWTPWIPPVNPPT
jgi:tetratricopeptide (TPR) repeat protein